MTQSSTSPPMQITEREKAALITLLADDDPEIFEPVRARILSSGPEAVEWLKAHSLSPDPLLRRNSRTIVRQFERHTADNEFILFCLSAGQDMDLEKGVFLLSRTAYPDINIEGYVALLDQFSDELADRLGSGTINGAGDYGFMLMATDGQANSGGEVDKFRIKIWDKATEALVYDNKMNAPETDDPTTELGGGSIVIHKNKLFFQM